MTTGAEETSVFWRSLLAGDRPQSRGFRRLVQAISPNVVDRCHLCSAPFTGPLAPAMRFIGRGRWQRSPRLCRQCETVLRRHPGGAETELAVVFADVRDSTGLAERTKPAEFAALIQRFYGAAT